ncbi:MAG: serine/threonine-protein kinase [Eubacteriales bacterium]|nr:serine/threonine-protein kinase [Eubacteriales bacterium]
MSRNNEKKSGNTNRPGESGNDFWASILGDALSEAASRLGKGPAEAERGAYRNPALPGTAPGLPDDGSDDDATLPEEDLTLPDDGGGGEDDATLPDDGGDGDMTLPEEDLTLPDGSDDDATLPEPSGKIVPVHADIPLTDSIRPGETLLGTYRIDSAPISGGMGRVWRVHHAGWNVDLAMKRPKPEFFRSRHDKQSFTEECRSWINLGLHPNIVSCYYVREIDGVPTIFSEWMDGGSAEKRIQDGTLYEINSGADWDDRDQKADRGNRNDGTEESGQEDRADRPETVLQERLLDLAIQFARGLGYAHENGLIHQDVKPDNLLLTREGEAKVSDFGLARARTFLAMTAQTGRRGGNRGGSRKGRAGKASEEIVLREQAGGEFRLDVNATQVTPAGGRTPSYCSPEQAAGLPLTRRTDIYSWAVSVMEMYLGGKPWAHGRDLTGPIAGAACRDYFEMCPEERRIPEKLQDLLAQCMEPLPEDRPHDFQEVEQTLRKIYAEVTGKDYHRPLPKAAADTADSLNNRALSLLDIGETAEAEKLWEEALKKDILHVDARFNRELFLLRSEKKYDYEVFEELSRYEEIKQSGALEALLQEYPGLKEDDSAKIRIDSRENFKSFRLHFSQVVRDSIQFAGESAIWQETGRLRKDGRGEDAVLLDLRGFLPMTRRVWGLYTALSPDGTRALVIMNDNTAVLVDLEQKSMISRSEKCRNLSGARSCRFHPGGDYVTAADGEQQAVFIFSLPDLTLLASFRKTQMIGFMPDGRCLLRRKVTSAREALFAADPMPCLDREGESGQAAMPEPDMEELFRFDHAIGDAREYAGEEGVFLAYSCHFAKTQKKPEKTEYYYLDENWQKNPLSARMYKSLENLLFYDAARSLLVSADREHVYFQDPVSRRFCYTVKGDCRFDHASYDREEEKLVLWQSGFFARWQTVPLPDFSHPFIPADWRLSRVMTAGKRFAMEDSLRAFLRAFTAAEESGNTAEMVRIHEKCLAVPGFPGSGTAMKMEDALEQTAGRGAFHALHYLERGDALPEAVRGGAYEISADGPDRELAAFVHDLLNPDPSAPDLNNPKKYGFPQFLEADWKNRRVLYYVSAPFTPFREEQETGVFQKDISTGEILRIMDRYIKSAVPRYLKDGSILLPPLPAKKEADCPDFCIRRISAADGHLIRSYRTGPDRMGLSDYCDVMLSPEKDRFMVKSFHSRTRHYLLFDLEAGLLATWKDDDISSYFDDVVRFIPGGRYLCYMAGYPGVFHLWDISENREVYRLPAGRVEFIAAQGDGRELWLEKKSPGGRSFLHYRIGYRYTCK